MKKSTIKQQMSKQLVTIGWNEPLENAAALMEERRIRHLPVLDDLGVVVGILSDRDVYRALNPSRPGYAPEPVVSDAMSWPVLTVDENLPLKAAAEGMIDQKISAFLVTDSNNNVTGIVTSEDLLRVLASLLGETSTLGKLAMSPVIGELVREAQASGL